MDAPTLSFNGEYTGTDATNLGSGPDVLRIGQNEKFDMYLADATDLGMITVSISATGGRTFKLYIDDVEKATTGSVSANTKQNLTFDATALTGALKISVENIGTGGATIGYISLAQTLPVSIANTSEAESKVYAQDSEIVIEAANGSAIGVVNILGSQIFAGKVSKEIEKISVFSGIYIVTLNGKAVKVIVK